MRLWFCFEYMDIRSILFYSKDSYRAIEKKKETRKLGSNFQ